MNDYYKVQTHNMQRILRPSLLYIVKVEFIVELMAVACQGQFSAQFLVVLEEVTHVIWILQ